MKLCKINDTDVRDLGFPHKALFGSIFNPVMHGDVIGASLSESHTDGKRLGQCMYVCIM